MLNAYISKDEIIKLLESAESINGMINKREFQRALLGIKEHKKPKKKNEKVIKIRNARDIIGSITKYSNKAKLEIGECDIIKDLCELFEKDKIENTLSLFMTQKEEWDKAAIDRIAYKVNYCNIVLQRDRLMGIFQISRPTLLKWLKIGIIVPHREFIVLAETHSNINKIELKNYIHIGEYAVYYDLEEIKRNIKKTI